MAPRHLARLPLLSTLTLLASASGTSFAQSLGIPMDDAIGAAEAVRGFRFGSAVAMEGGITLVGATGRPPHGAAYFFDSATGVELGRLLPLPGGFTSSSFGFAVDLTATTAIVGAPSEDGVSYSYEGAAYLYSLPSGVRIARLEVEGPPSSRRLGWSVAIDGDRALVGTSDRGEAFVFSSITGVQERKLVAPDGSDDFGYSVALDDSIAVVGDRSHFAGVSWGGAAYVFDVATGDLLHQLTAFDRQRDDRFGAAVTIRGNTILVGAPGVDEAADDGGAVYVFDASTGAELAKLMADDAIENQKLGSSVALAEGLAIAGAPATYVVVDGACYVFQIATGTQVMKLVPYLNDRREFGEAVASDGANLAVGFERGAFTEPYSGAVYRLESLPVVGHRNAGANPDSFTSHSALTGLDLRFTVDLTTTGHSDALVIGFDSPVQILLAGGQTLLCLDLLGQGEMINTGFHAGPLAVIDVPIPEDPSLLGLEICTQAVHAFGVTPFALSNAQDLVLSGCPHPTEWSYKLLDANAQPSDELGRVVAVSGNVALLGTDQSDENGPQSGSAHLFDTTTGMPLFELLPGDGAADDHFGMSVGISGNTAIVGAYLNDSVAPAAGSAYLFDVATGLEVAQLSSSDHVQDDWLGWSVAIDGPIALVGAPGDDDNGVQSGSAYAFDVSTGIQIQKLVPLDGTPLENFGNAVALDGTTAVVGAFRDDTPLFDEGSAYVFDITTGIQTAKLTAPDAEAGDHFGATVAIGGGIVAVAAPDRLESGSAGYFAGAVYLFDAASGTFLHKLVVHNPGGSWGTRRFGQSLDMDGTTLAVADPDGLYAYVFDASTGQQLRTLVPGCDLVTLPSFAGAVAIDGPTIVVSSPRDDTQAPGAGSALVF